MLGLLSLLTACAASTPSIEARISLPELPAEVKTCEGPLRVPHVDANQAQVEKWWRQDRKRLVICRKTNESLVLFYEDLKAQLSASPES